MIRFSVNVVRGKVISRLISKIEDLAGWFILLSGWHRYSVALLAGIVSALAMPPFDLVFVLFATFPILVWLMDGAASEPSSGLFSKLWDGFKPGFFFGFGYFFAGLWWIGNAFIVEAKDFLWALPIAITAVPFALALFWGAATALARLFWSGNAGRLFMLSACFTLMEYCRGFVATGLPWNPISGAAFFSPLMMQSASVTGIYGMTAFAVFVFAAAGVIVPDIDNQTRSRKFVLAVASIFVLSHVGYGVWRLQEATTEFVPEVSLRLVQPNIEQVSKFDDAKEAQNFQTYMDLSVSEGEGDKTGLSGTTHLIWPESVFPYLLTQRRDTLAAIGAMLPEGTILLTGAARAEAATSGSDGFVFNSIYVINGGGEIVSAADKTHLVPFGEYVPFAGLADTLGIEQLANQDGGFEPGSSRKLLSTGIGPKILPLICYEIIFSGQLWNEEERPGWIMNLTNDAWFGNTPGPYQHLRQSILRGVEEGLPVVRVANSGISGVYDAYGRTMEELPLGEAGIIDAQLPVALKPTLFKVWNGTSHWIIFGLFFIIGLVSLRKYNG